VPRSRRSTFHPSQTRRLVPAQPDAFQPRQLNGAFDRGERGGGGAAASRCVPWLAAIALRFAVGACGHGQGVAPGARRGGAHATPERRCCSAGLSVGPFCAHSGRVDALGAEDGVWAGFFFGPMRASQHLGGIRKGEKEKSNVATHLGVSLLHFPARFRCMCDSVSK